MLICFPGRDDADNFFAICVLLAINMHHKQYCFLHRTDGVPALLTV